MIHLADPAGGLRFLCGAGDDGASWTTVPVIATCPACASLEAARRMVRAVAARSWASMAPGPGAAEAPAAAELREGARRAS